MSRYYNSKGIPWSKLGREIKKLWDSNLKLEIHCTSMPLRGKTAIGSTTFPRYCITLNKEIIFDYPGQFLDSVCCKAQWWQKRYADENGNIKIRDSYPYECHTVSEISVLIREYIDREKDRLFEPFGNDRWNLIPILRAADKRIGKRRLEKIETDNEGAKKIISLRLNT